MKQLFMSSRVLAGLIVVLVLPLPALAQSSTSTFGETIDVRVVNVEAVVTDRNGVRVFGLTPEDFRLLIGGKEVPIEFFTEIRGGEALRDAGASPWDIAPISEGQTRGTSYLVFIDDFFSIAVDRNRVLRALAEQLTFLQEGDRMAIVAWDGDLAHGTCHSSILQRTFPHQGRYRCLARGACHTSIHRYIYSHQRRHRCLARGACHSSIHRHICFRQQR